MANELSALLEVAGETVDRLAITPTQSLHRAIARRSFSAVGPLATPARLVHDGISDPVYVAIRTTASALTTRGSSRHDGGDALPFGARLRTDLGITPVDVRYNTGLHVSENGSRLDLLLEQLITAWPVELRELSLIGHSMGGLVARSAYTAATAAKPGRRWPALTTRVVTLGTPHTGAPLEKAARLASWALQKVPEAEPLADILDTRSSGIRDLRHGYLLGDE